MIEIEIPGFSRLVLEYMVLDYNGTLAVDGEVVPGVADALNGLAAHLEVHVLTADTFGKARRGLEGINCRLSILPPGNQDEAKRQYVERLGSDRTVCVGNGRNDQRMLKAAALGIAVILEEGVAVETLLAADVVCKDILSALALVVEGLRVTATLRS